MKKLFLSITLAVMCFVGFAQNPVQVANPQIFLKWIRVADSIRGAIYLQGGDTLATMAYARGFGGAGVGYGIKNTGGILRWDSAGVRKTDSLYALNDSTIAFKINGVVRSFVIRGTGNSTTPCTGCLLAANNLNDLSDPATARANLGLGTAATLDVPVSGDANAGQVVMGNDTRLGGSGLTFENGVSRVVDDIKLGGLLTGNTTIDGDGLWQLNMPSLKKFTLQAFGVAQVKGDTTIIESANVAPNIVVIRTGAALERIKINNSGDITFPTLAVNSDTTANKPAVYNPTTKGFSYLDHWPVGTGGGMTNPMTAAGDIIYGGSGGSPLRLPAGSSHQLLHSGTTPGYSAVDLTVDVSGLLPDANISSAAAWNAKQAALGYTPENVANKNANSGYAGLNGSGKVAWPQLDSNHTTGIVSWPGLLAQGYGTGGGTPTLPQAFAAGRTFTGNDSMNMGAFSMYIRGKLKGDTVRINVNDPLPTGKIYTMTGTSVTEGSGASDPKKINAQLIGDGLQMSLNNQGHGGYTLSNPPGTGAPSFLSIYTTSIPTKDATHVLMGHAWGENDALYAASYCCPPGGPLDYSTARFIAAYHTIIDYCISQGWDSTNMFIVSPIWQTSVNPVFQDSVFNAARDVAAFYHLLFIDDYHAGQFSAPADKVDQVHPSDRGHANRANIVLHNLDSANLVKINGQTFASNGVTEVQKLVIRGTDTANHSAELLVRNPDGHVSVMPADVFMKLQNDLGHYLQTGNFWGQGTINAGGDIVSGGIGWFGGQIAVGTRIGATLGLQGSKVYLSGWNGLTALDAEISNGGQTTAIGGAINGTRPSISAGSTVQGYGGAYFSHWVIIDSNDFRHAGRPLTMTTDGLVLTWHDKNGNEHDISVPGSGIDHIAPIDTLTAVNDGLQIVSGHILAAQTATATKPGMVTLNLIKGIAHDTAVAIRSFFESGTYTPTLTDANSWVSGPSAGLAHWMRIGNQVFVDGYLAGTPGGTGSASTIDISLPTGVSAFSSSEDAAGVVSYEGGGGASDYGNGKGEANVVTGLVTITVSADAAGKYFYHVTYTYFAP